ELMDRQEDRGGVNHLWYIRGANEQFAAVHRYHKHSPGNPGRFISPGTGLARLQRMIVGIIFCLF
ncbi:hypothetical protein JYI50_11285, partial [Escherichia fergusonii]|nr:hypothetical protein [Escherichia fergusonii]